MLVRAFKKEYSICWVETPIQQASLADADMLAWLKREILSQRNTTETWRYQVDRTTVSARCVQRKR